MRVELLIDNRNELQIPAVVSGITWATERKGTPGKLTFTVLKDKKTNFTEGNAVRLTVDGKKVFYGFIFTKKSDRENKITVTAYDQLRYLKNKDTYVYTKKTASDLIKMIAKDFKLQLGQVENTSFVVPSRVEDNKMLFDIIQNALDLEIRNKKKMFILYDDFGKITLKALENMKYPLLIDDQTAENYEYTSSIDDEVYNKVKLVYENDKTGKREVYVMQDGNNINNWGILQFFETLKEGENGSEKAKALLGLHNVKNRKIKITKAFGDVNVRAGSLLPVRLTLADMKINNFMLVEKCAHNFDENYHTMDLTLRGGEFVV